MLGIILLTTIFSLIYAIILYGVGYYGGNKLLERFRKKSKRIKKKIDIGNELFNKESSISLLIIRLIPFSRTCVSFLAGVYKQDFYFYIFCSAFGILFWNAIFISLGFTVFLNLDNIAYIYDNAKILILLAFSVSIIMLFLIKKCSKKR